MNIFVVGLTTSDFSQGAIGLTQVTTATGRFSGSEDRFAHASSVDHFTDLMKQVQVVMKDSTAFAGPLICISSSSTQVISVLHWQAILPSACRTSSEAVPEHLTQPWIVVSFDGTPRKTFAKQVVAKTSVKLTEIVSIRGILLFVVIHAHMSSPRDDSGAGALI